MLCINFETSQLTHATEAIRQLVSTATATKMTEHFVENWQDKINEFTRNYLTERGASLRQLASHEKRELVWALKQNGAFKQKRAAEYVASALKISRATVYGYLKKMEEMT